MKPPQPLPELSIRGMCRAADFWRADGRQGASGLLCRALRGAREYVGWFVVASLLVVTSGAMGQVPAGSAHRTVTNAPAELLYPPLPKSPVEQFRELLAMNDAELTRALTNRTPESRRLVLGKIKEYRALPAEERDLRLKVTEVRWYLLPLMRMPASNRVEQLSLMPAEDRKLVEARLVQWDLLPPPLQQQLLENEATVNYLLSSGAQSRSNALATLPQARREQLEADLRRLDAMSEVQRQQVLAQFKAFFDFTPREKERILGSLPDPERAQIQKTLNTFAGLPPTQRSQCIRSFGKFASLTPRERQQFFQNAERWKLMTPSERQAWRELVAKLSSQPPLPPGLGGPPSPPGPRPASKPRSSPVVATNS